MVKKRKMSEATKLRLSTVKIQKGKKPIKELSLTRLLIEPDNYSNFINELEKLPYFISKIPIGKYKRSLKDLNINHLLALNPSSEILWAKTILNHNFKYINEFVELSNNYSKNVLKGNYEEAEDVLNKIEERFGQSLWLIKNKISFYQIAYGLEKHKSYVNELRSSLNDNRILNFIIYWISVRNEDNTSVDRFNSKINKIIEEFTEETHPGFTEYCKYHLLGNETLSLEEYCQVIRMDYSRSFIDLYESFIALLTYYNNYEDTPLNVEAIIFKFCLKINDNRLNFIRDLYFGIKDNKLYGYLSSVKKIEDHFFQGNYEDGFDCALVGLTDMPVSSGFLILASKCMSMIMSTYEPAIKLTQKKTSLIENIICAFSKLYLSGSYGDKESLEFLKKVELNFSSFRVTKCFDFVIRGEAKSLYEYNDIDFKLILRSYEFSPIYYHGHIVSKLQDLYYNRCRELNVDSLQNKFKNEIKSGIFATKGISISDDATNLVLSASLFYEEKYDHSIEISKKLASSNYGYYSRQGIGLSSFAYLKKGDLLSACSLIVDSFIEDPEIYSYLPIEELIEIVRPGTSEWKNLCVNIEFPILWDIYTTFFNKEGSISRSYAYEDFLFENGMQKPSELEERYNEFDSNKLIYYLKEICIEENMDTSDAFEEGSKEILEERLKVCRFLNLIAPIINEEIQKEISEIIQKQVISKNTKEFDNSRVQVDTPGIKRWAQNELKESYNRLQAYLKHGIRINQTPNKNNFTTPNNSLSVPTDEVNSILRTMIEDLLKAYLSEDYGLDRFLSTRIRHGKLDRHLRRPVLEEKIYTKRESEKGKYLKNEFILSKINNVNDFYLKSEIDKICSNFSRLFDNMIFELSNDWIQINSNNKPKGLFNFRIEDEGIIQMAKEIKPETSLSEFIDFILNQFNNSLVLNLANIREKLNTTAKSKGKKLLIKFGSDLNKYSDDINFNEINDAISRAKTALQTQFDNITGWFVPSITGDSPPFTIVDAIDVAQADLLEDGDRIEIQIDTEGELFQIHGNLPHFVDIFTNIFDNILKRSNLEKPKAVVKILVQDKSDDYQIIKIDVFNEMGLIDNLNELKTKLKRKKELLQEGRYEDYIVSEGDSGLFKIHKFVSELGINDLGITSSMDFELNEHGFNISMLIPFRIFSLDLEDENIITDENITS